jgi:hypothetical protein
VEVRALRATHLVILIDAYPQHDWLLRAVEKRLREEFAKLQVEINEEKRRIVNLGQGESFGFLGFEFRHIRSLRGVWRAHYTPKLKKRTALLRKLKDVFRRCQSQPVDRESWPRLFGHGLKWKNCSVLAYERSSHDETIPSKAYSGV